MSPVISVEHLSKTYLLGQIGTPSESTRPFAAPRMLREGELPALSRATWKSGGPSCVAPVANPLFRHLRSTQGSALVRKIMVIVMA